MREKLTLFWLSFCLLFNQTSKFFFFSFFYFSCIWGAAWCTCRWGRGEGERRVETEGQEGTGWLVQAPCRAAGENAWKQQVSDASQLHFCSKIDLLAVMLEWLIFSLLAENYGFSSLFWVKRLACGYQISSGLLGCLAERKAAANRNRFCCYGYSSLKACCVLSFSARFRWRVIIILLRPSIDTDPINW